MEALWQRLHIVKDVLHPLNYSIEKMHCHLPTSLNFFGCKFYYTDCHYSMILVYAYNQFLTNTC